MTAAEAPLGVGAGSTVGTADGTPGGSVAAAPVVSDVPDTAAAAGAGVGFGASGSLPPEPAAASEGGYGGGVGGGGDGVLGAPAVPPAVPEAPSLALDPTPTPSSSTGASHFDRLSISHARQAKLCQDALALLHSLQVCSVLPLCRWELFVVLERQLVALRPTHSVNEGLYRDIECVIAQLRSFCTNR